MTATTPPPLAADLNEGLKRLKMAAMRRLAPELLVTAKTQRWKPEEFLRTLVEAEIAARDASNARTRMRQAAFPVTKTLDEFDVAASSIPPATFDYLASLEWIRAAENVCLIGPAGTGKSHILVALGDRRGRGRAPGPLLHRRRTGRDPLPRPGRQLRRPGHRHPAAQRPGHRRRARVRPAGRHRRPTAVPVRRRRLRTPLPRHRLALALRVLGPVPARTHHRRQHARPAPAPLPHRRHRRRLLPHETSPSRREEPDSRPAEHPAKGGDFQLATSGDRNLAVDKTRHDSNRNRPQMTKPLNWLRPEACRVVSSRLLGWQTTDRLSPLRPDRSTEPDAAYSVTTTLRPDFAKPIVGNTRISPRPARSPRSTILWRHRDRADRARSVRLRAHAMRQ